MTNLNVSHQPVEDCWNRIGVRGNRSCGKLREHHHCRNCEVYADAARNIMRRAFPADYQRDWAQNFSQQEQVRQIADQSALVFRIGSEWLALPARQSLTVATAGAVHSMPHRSGKTLMGIVNVKGKLYPCMSLANLMEIDSVEPPPKPGHRVYPRLLVMQLDQQAFALPVQDLFGIHRHAASDLQTPPATANRSMHRYLKGVLSVEDIRIGCLDAELIGYNLASHLK